MDNYILSPIDPVSLYVLISQFRPSDVLPSFLRFYFQVRAFSIDLIHDTRHLCTRSRIDGIKAVSRCISGGKQVIKSANMSNHGRVCSFYQNETTISQSCKMYISSFGKIYVFTACQEDIYGRYCTQKSRLTMITSTHDFDIIVFKIRSSSFPVV